MRLVNKINESGVVKVWAALRVSTGSGRELICERSHVLCCRANVRTPPL